MKKQLLIILVSLSILFFSMSFAVVAGSEEGSASTQGFNVIIEYEDDNFSSVIEFGDDSTDYSPQEPPVEITENDLELYISGPFQYDESEDNSSGGNIGFSEFPQLPQPPFGLENKGSVNIENWSQPTVIYSNSYFNNMVVKSTLVIDTRYGDRIIRVKNLTFGSNGNIEVRGNGKVRFYVENDLHVSNGSRINGSGRPGALEVYHTGNRVTFQGGAGGNDNYKFSGTLYTTGSEVIIRNGANIKGEIYAERADINIFGGVTTDQLIYTRGGNIQLNGGANVSGRLICGGNMIKITGGSKFNGLSGGIYAPDANIVVEQGSTLLGPIRADTDKVSLNNINQRQSNYWFGSIGEQNNKVGGSIREVIVHTSKKNPSFRLYAWINNSWVKINASSKSSYSVRFDKYMTTRRLLIKNSGNNPISRVEIN
ncbi:MAG: polymer-forming cytoskeletal protein [Bacillota bacterium]